MFSNDDLDFSASRTTILSAVYIYGSCRNKKIVLYDTLIEILTNQEIAAVLAHEFGHWNGNHVFKISAYIQVRAC